MVDVEHRDWLSEYRGLQKDRSYTATQAAELITEVGQRLADDEEGRIGIIQRTREVMEEGLLGRLNKEQIEQIVRSTKNQIGYAIALSKLLAKGLDQRGVHALLNSGRDPRVEIGAVGGGILRFRIDELIALAVVWRVSCEPFFPVTPEYRKKTAELFDERHIRRMLKLEEGYLYLTDGKPTIVTSEKEESALGVASLNSICIRLIDLISQVVEAAEDKKQEQG